MLIHEDWLWDPIPPAEVEERLAVDGAPELWLWAWRALLGRWAPGDELWTYCGCEPTSDGEGDWLHEGFALVRGGEIVDWIETPF